MRRIIDILSTPVVFLGFLLLAAATYITPSTTPVRPQGRLTLTSGAPVMSADVAAGTTVYYTPAIGNVAPINNGSGFVETTFSELSLALDSNNAHTGYQKATNNYDLFVANDAGTVRLCTGPAWNYNATITVTIASPAVVTWTGHGLPEGSPVVFTTSGALPTGITAGTVYYVSKSPAANTFNISTSIANAAAGTLVNTSGSQSGTHTGTNGTAQRGTGAGTTQLSQVGGLWVNTVSMTCRFGSASGNTITVGANQGTYVGSMYATADGTTAMAFAPAAAGGGSNAFLALYNAWNRTAYRSASRDNTSSWTYNSTTWRSTNGNTNNRVNVLDGLGQMTVRGRAQINGLVSVSSAIMGANCNSTTATPAVAAVASAAAGTTMVVPIRCAPTLGLNYVQGMEASSGASNATFNGVSFSQQTQAIVVDVEM